MRSYSGPFGGYVHPVSPVQAAPAPAAPAPAAPVPSAPAPAGTAAGLCPHCGAALPSPEGEYCPQCGDPVSETSPAARVRRLLSNRYLVGALAVVFVLLLAGILLAGQGEGSPSGPSAQAAAVGPVTSPTVTAVMVRSTPSSAPAAPGRSTVPGAANASGTVTPRPNQTVLVVKTLDRYIQNAGGDPGSQLRTPTLPATPTSPSPVPTSASKRMGNNLSWSGEGTYVTELFALEAGTIQVEMGAGVLTMAQLRDSTGTAIGIATAGPQPATTAIRVPTAGTYRLEIWPFGSGPWTVTISTVFSPTAMPTLAPATATTTTAIVIPETLPVTAETTVPSTPTPTAEPTQAPRTFTGNGTAATPPFPLNAGLALFSYSTTTTGIFSVTLIDDGGGVASMIALVDGPTSGSKAISVPATASYRLNVNATGSWEVSVA
jgi:hypothetical protein